MERVVKPDREAKSWPLFVLIYVNDVPTHLGDVGKKFPVAIILGGRQREIRKWSLWFQLSRTSDLPCENPICRFATRYSILLIGFWKPIRPP